MLHGAIQDWVAWGCVLCVGRFWCCSIPICFPPTVAVPWGSRVDSQEGVVKYGQTLQWGDVAAFGVVGVFGHPTPTYPAAQGCRGLPSFLRRQAVLVFFGCHEKSGFKNTAEHVLWCSAMCSQGCRGFAMAVRRVLIQALEGGSSQSPLTVLSKE